MTPVSYCQQYFLIPFIENHFMHKYGSSVYFFWMMKTRQSHPQNPKTLVSYRQQLTEDLYPATLTSGPVLDPSSARYNLYKNPVQLRKDTSMGRYFVQDKKFTSTSDYRQDLVYFQLFSMSNGSQFNTTNKPFAYNKKEK